MGASVEPAAPHLLTGVHVVDDEDSVSLQRAADLLGVHYMTAYRYIRLGQLVATKVGSNWRVLRSDVDAVKAGSAVAFGTRGRGRAQAAPWAERLENRLRAGDELGSWGVLEAALASGAEPADLYLEVISPPLRSIGEAWARGELDIAVEHRASAIVTRLLGRLGPRFARRGRSRGAVLLGAPPGDRHCLPVAMLADLVRGAGFTAVDLGADLPAASFAAVAAEVSPLVAVALTVTCTEGYTSAAATVATIHALLPGVPVLVGGGVIADEATALALGADGWAVDARGAITLLDQLVA